MGLCAYIRHNKGDPKKKKKKKIEILGRFRQLFYGQVLDPIMQMLGHIISFLPDHLLDTLPT